VYRKRFPEEKSRHRQPFARRQQSKILGEEIGGHRQNSMVDKADKKVLGECFPKFQFTAGLAVTERTSVQRGPW
jgi:hypothetical protein